MHPYEIALIIRTQVDEAGQKALIERLSEILSADGGKVDNVETWGRRKLAYPIKKVQEGIYYFIQGQFVPAVLPELERTMKLSEDIVRYMIVRQD